MKNKKTGLLGILLAFVVLAASAAPAAASFYHPRGIVITTYPQHIVIFWGGPGYYQEQLAVVILPAWYFVEDLMGFDSVTLTITLVGSPVEDGRYVCPLCRHNGESLKILGADQNGVLVIRMSAVSMTEEENGALLLVPITFIINEWTGSGGYIMYLSAVAYSSQATFVGWDQVPVTVYPGMFLG